MQFFFKLLYEDFLWQLCNFWQKLCNNKIKTSRVGGISRVGQVMPIHLFGGPKWSCLIPSFHLTLTDFTLHFTMNEYNFMQFLAMCQDIAGNSVVLFIQFKFKWCIPFVWFSCAIAMIHVPVTMGNSGWAGMCVTVKWRLARMIPREWRRCTLSAELIMNPKTGAIIKN